LLKFIFIVLNVNKCYIFVPTNKQIEIMTSQDFQNRLVELQNESKNLLLISSKRVKATRERIQEINKEFFAVKQEWRESYPTI